MLSKIYREVYRSGAGLSNTWQLVIRLPDGVEVPGLLCRCSPHKAENSSLPAAPDQGLEVDYIGVIVGPDLVVWEGQMRTLPAARDSNDESIRGYRTRMLNDPAAAARETDRIIKNTYCTLTTRDMRGCYLYCTDAETARYFRQKLSSEALPNP